MLHRYELDNIIESINNLKEKLLCVSSSLDLDEEAETQLRILNGQISKIVELHSDDENVRRTCINCAHYHPTIIDPNDEKGYHIHDHCSAWDAKIPDYTIFDRLGYEEGFGDIECGIAGCWCFEPKPGNKLVCEFPCMTQNKNNGDKE